LLSAHKTNRHTKDYIFPIRFAKVPMRLEPREPRHHSLYDAKHKSKKLWFLSKQCSEDISLPNIELSKVHPVYYLQNTGSCAFSLLPTVHLHPVFRLIMTNDRCPLILHFVLTCRRNILDITLFHPYKWKDGCEHCFWVWAVDSTHAVSII